MITTALPTPGLLRAAPQLAALTILYAALLAAEETLLAHYPNLEILDDLPHNERAPPDDCLVPILVARFDELRLLLNRYYAAVRATLLTRDDIPF